MMKRKTRLASDIYDIIYYFTDKENMKKFFEECYEKRSGVIQEMTKNFLA